MTKVVPKSSGSNKPPASGGGVTPFMRRGGESPKALSLAPNTVEQQEPKRITNAPKSEAESTSPPVYSQIKGLHDKDPAFGDDYATHLSHGIVDIRSERRGKIWMIVIGVIVAIFVGLMVISPNFRHRVGRHFEFVADAYHWLVRHRQGTKKIAAVNEDLSEAKEEISQGSDKFKLHQLKVASEAELNKTPYLKNELGARYLTQVADDLFAGRLSVAEKLVKDRCRVWQQTNTCVAKLLVLAKTGTNQSLLRETSFLFKTEGALSPIAQSFLLYAGGVIAHREGQSGISDQRFQRALRVVPRAAEVFKQEIALRAAIIYLSRGELLPAKRAIKTVSKLSGPLEMVESLIRPGSKTSQLRRIFGAEKTILILAQHPELFDLLGVEAFKQNMSKEFVSLLDRFSKSRATAKDGLRLAAQWKIRLALAGGHMQKARSLLASYARDLGDDAFVSHMEGIALLAQNQNENQAVAAAMKFQDALRYGRSWETLWALGYALIRANKGNEVGAVLGELERTAHANGQRYWIDLLKGEWYLASEKFLLAQKIVMVWRGKAPERQGPMRLSIGIYRKLGKASDVKKEEEALKRAMQKASYWVSAEGLSSPLGFMALGIRPMVD